MLVEFGWIEKVLCNKLVKLEHQLRFKILEFCTFSLFEIKQQQKVYRNGVEHSPSTPPAENCIDGLLYRMQHDCTI